MSVAALKVLRQRVSTDFPMMAFWLDYYAKHPKEIIGYQHSRNANDYPFISYVSVRNRLGNPNYDTYLVSVVVGVHEPGETSGVYDGVSRLDEVESLLYTALIEGELGSGLLFPDGIITVTKDLGKQHPFYEMELKFLLQKRRG